MTDLYGTALNDRLSTGTADDNVFGGEGNDTLSAGSGTDFLYGGNGNDHIRGTNVGGSKDVLTGGNGADIFRISGGYESPRSENSVEIKDYSSEDRIEFGFSEGYNLDNLYTTHFGTGDNVASFIYEGDSGELLASVAGEQYNLPPVGFR